MRKLRRFALLFTAPLLLSANAFALKNASVQSDSVQVLQSSDPTSFAVEILQQGARVTTSDAPSGGFYKVRTASGHVGWIAETSLGFSKQAVPASKSSVERPRVGQSAPRRIKYGVRLFGGIDFFNLKDFDDTPLGPISMKNGAEYGIEGMYRFNPRVKGMIHLERISKLISINVDNPVAVYDLSVSSMPVMIGGGYSLKRTRSFELALTGLAGLGLGTKFSSTLSNANAPNETVYGGSPLTFIGRFDLDFRPQGLVWLGGNVGYRMLKISPGGPSSKGTGSALFQGPDGSSRSYGLNLSGLFMNISVTYWF